MSANSRSSAVRTALDELKRYLQAFIVDVRGAALIPISTRPDRLARSGKPEMVSVHDADISALAGVVLDEWPIFAPRLPPLARSYFRELKDIRNHWAHEREFSADELQRSLDTIRLVGQAIGRPGSPVSGRHEGPAPPSAAVPFAVQRSTVKSPTALGEVKRDAAGVIINATELVAEQLVHERVLCPACGRKVFAMWPEGWDAHAGSLKACVADLGDSGPQRKAEYKRQYRALFR